MPCTGTGRDDREEQVRAYAQGERPRGIPEAAAAAILARHAPLTAVMADLFRKLQRESRETPYALEEIRRIGRMYLRAITSPVPPLRSRQHLEERRHRPRGECNERQEVKGTPRKHG